MSRTMILLAVSLLVSAIVAKSTSELNVRKLTALHQDSPTDNILFQHCKRKCSNNFECFIKCVEGPMLRTFSKKLPQKYDEQEDDEVFSELVVHTHNKQAYCEGVCAANQNGFSKTLCFNKCFNNLL